MTSTFVCRAVLVVLASTACHAQITSLPSPVVRPVSRPPASAAAPLRLRASTAEAAGARAKLDQPKSLPAAARASAANTSAAGTSGDGSTIGPGRDQTAASGADRTGHWLLLFRRTQCVPCDTLMAALAGSTSPLLRNGEPYTVIVADGQPESLSALRSRFAGLDQAVWLADADRHYASLLKPHGSPTLYAMDGDTIAWAAPGNVEGAAAVAHRADAWLAAPSTAAQTTSAKTAAAKTAGSTAMATASR